MKEGDLASVFQVIKSKGAAVSAFQWRKLREAALICPSIDPDLLISVYEASIQYSLRARDWAEAHIALSRLQRLYGSHRRSFYNTEHLCSIILFKYFYCNDLQELDHLWSQLPPDQQRLPQCDLAWGVVTLAISQNIVHLRRLVLRGAEKLILDEIIKRAEAELGLAVFRAYPLLPPSWIEQLFNQPKFECIDDARTFAVQKLMLDPDRVGINSERTKLVSRRKK